MDELPIDALPSAFDRLGLDGLGDDELVAAMAEVVAEPREGPADSFVLHAPLELTARARLLALTPDEPDLRRLARLRLASIAARYRHHPAADLGSGPGPGAAASDAGDPTNPVDAMGAVIDAIATGDLPGVDDAVRRAADTPAESLVARLAPAIADRTAAAAHGPIFLATLTEAPRSAPGWRTMLRPLARELARRPDWRLDWFQRAGSDRAPGDTPDEAGLFAALADPPRLGIGESTFIHPTMLRVDAPGVADEVLGPVAGPGAVVTAETSRAITRVAALAMVNDTPDHAPYGWTHCLTLPQAILTLAPQLEAAGVPALAIAATHVLGFRATLGTITLRADDPLIRPADPDTAEARRSRLVTEAALRHDAHVAKYVLASLTQADRDPEAGELHLRAAEHLLAVWDDLGPDPDDILAETAGAVGAGRT